VLGSNARGLWGQQLPAGGESKSRPAPQRKDHA